MYTIARIFISKTAHTYGYIVKVHKKNSKETQRMRRHVTCMPLCLYMHIRTSLRGLSVKAPIYTYFIPATTKGESGKLIESSVHGWYTI